jgi:cell division protein FtsI (penicillin-binding protein 3)
VFLVCVLMIFSLFAAQLVRLQGLDAATVSAAAIDDRLRQVIIPADRGTITDVNDQRLALDVAKVHVAVDPVNVRCYTLTSAECADPAQGSRGIAAAAADIGEVTGEDPARLASIIQSTTGRWGYLLKDVSPQRWQQIRALDIPGITAEDHHRRFYPMGESHAPLLGWLGTGGQPAGGVELTRDDILTGRPGERSFEIGGNGEVITTALSVESPPVAGESVRLTIDSDLQWYAYDAIEQRVKEAGGLSGYVLVQEVSTGKLVAAAGYPSFDPAEATQTADGMRNPIIEDVYEPGSTSKLITAAAALEEGIMTQDTPFVVPNRLPRAGTTFRDAHDPETPYLTFAGVLATSSNMGTIMYGEKLDDQVFYDYLRSFGLGEVSGLGLPGESAGVVPEPKTWSRTSKFTMMFGQGLSTNPLQQLGVYQTVANGGVHLPPSVIEGVTDQQGVYTATPPAASERLLREDTTQTLTDILMHVPTDEGTAPTAAVDGYHVAGKTSTADRFDPDLGRYKGVTASFVGFAPAETPKYVVAVTVQRPTRISKYGGTISGPVFADVMRYALQRQGVPPSGGSIPEIALTYDPQQQAPGEDQGVTLGDVAVSDERPDE